MNATEPEKTKINKPYKSIELCFGHTYYYDNVTIFPFIFTSLSTILGLPVYYRAEE